MSNHSEPTRHFCVLSMNSKLRRIVLACGACIVIVLSAYTATHAAGSSPTAFRPQDVSYQVQATNPSEPEPLTLTDEQGQYSLGLHLEILEDPERGSDHRSGLLPGIMILQFIPSQVEVPNYGYTDSAYWVRVRSGE